MLEIKVIEKNVYGTTLTYPYDDLAKKFAAFLGVKTFTYSKLLEIENLGYTIINVTPKP